MRSHIQVGVVSTRRHVDLPDRTFQRRNHDGPRDRHCRAGTPRVQAARRHNQLTTHGRDPERNLLRIGGRKDRFRGMTLAVQGKPRCRRPGHADQQPPVHMAQAGYLSLRLAHVTQNLRTAPTEWPLTHRSYLYLRFHHVLEPLRPAPPHRR
jgi:hypothetical protein